MNSHIFLSIQAGMLGSHFHIVKRRRLNLEIQLSWDILERDWLRELAPVIEERERTGMKIAVHAPFIDMAPGAADPAMREATFKRLAQSAAVAERTGAVVMVVHPGYDEKRYWGDHDGYVQRSMETWRRLLGATEKSGVTIALENIYEKSPDILAEVIGKVDSPRFAACFDAGHFNVYAKSPLDQWMAALGPKITHLHLHNNHGKEDEHNGMKSGTFDFRAFFGKLSAFDTSPTMTMEPHKENGVEESLASLDELGVAGPHADMADAKAV